MEPLDNIRNQMPNAPDVGSGDEFSGGRSDYNPQPQADPTIPNNIDISLPKRPGGFSRRKRKQQGGEEQPAQEVADNQSQQNQNGGNQQTVQPPNPGNQTQFNNNNRGNQTQFNQPSNAASNSPLFNLFGVLLIAVCSLIVPAIAGYTIYKLAVSDMAKENTPSAVLEQRGLSELEKRTLISDVLLRAKVASPVSVEISDEDVKVLMDKLKWTMNSTTKVKESSLSDGSKLYLRGNELIYILPEEQN